MQQTEEIHQSAELAPAGPVLAIVIPTLNERENIGPLIGKISEAMGETSWELVFVDDDSKDGTIDLLMDVCQHDRRVRAVRRRGRRGLSSAVVEGIQSTTTPYVAVMDADLQHDETLLPAMLKRLRNDTADIVVGSRYVDGGSVVDWDARRQKISRVATVLAHYVVKADLSDPMSGFFMLKRSTFEAASRNLSQQGYKILLDIIASSPTQPRIAELPYVFGLRQHGESKLDALVTLEYLNLLLDKLLHGTVPPRFILFGAIGGMGLVVHMMVLSALLASGRLVFVVAQSVATVVAMTFNFFVNNTLTYRDRRLRGTRAILGGLLSFYAVCSIGALANVGIANVLFNDRYSWWIAGVAGVLVGALWNYVLASIFTWKT